MQDLSAQTILLDHKTIEGCPGKETAAADQRSHRGWVPPMWEKDGRSSPQ